MIVCLLSIQTLLSTRCELKQLPFVDLLDIKWKRPSSLLMIAFLTHVSVLGLKYFPDRWNV